MNVMDAVFLVVVIVAVTSLIRSWHNGRNGYAIDADGNPVGPSRRERELEAELTDLRERVKVLERIATDDRETKRLSAEIESLRDK